MQHHADDVRLTPPPNHVKARTAPTPRRRREHAGDASIFVPSGKDVGGRSRRPRSNRSSSSATGRAIPARFDQIERRYDWRDCFASTTGGGFVRVWVTQNGVSRVRRRTRSRWIREAARHQSRPSSRAKRGICFSRALEADRLSGVARADRARSCSSYRATSRSLVAALLGMTAAAASRVAHWPRTFQVPSPYSPGP